MTFPAGLKPVVDADFARQLERELVAALKLSSINVEAELLKERELRIMQLAAISTASIQNTESSVAERIGPGHDYSSGAYQDTCRAVDREMQHRKDRDQWRECAKELAESVVSNNSSLAIAAYARFNELSKGGDKKQSAK